MMHSKPGQYPPDLAIKPRCTSNTWELEDEGDHILATCLNCGMEIKVKVPETFRDLGGHNLKVDAMASPPMFTSRLTAEEWDRITDPSRPLKPSPVSYSQPISRAEIAAMALQGILSGMPDDADCDIPKTAEIAVRIADTLIAALKKPRET